MLAGLFRGFFGKANDLAALAFAWAPRWPRLGSGFGLELCGQNFTRLDAGLGFRIQINGLAGAQPLMTERSDFDMIFVRATPYAERNPGTDCLGRFRSVAIDQHFTRLDSAGRECPGFKKAGSPQPFIEPDAR